MRYFKLFDELQPSGDLYRFDGESLYMKGDDETWHTIIEFAWFGFDTPEDYFKVYIEGALVVKGDTTARFEEVSV